MKTRRLICGDQRTENTAALDSDILAHDTALMAEMADETVHVPHHKQRLLHHPGADTSLRPTTYRAWPRGRTGPAGRRTRHLDRVESGRTRSLIILIGGRNSGPRSENCLKVPMRIAGKVG